MSCSPPPLSGYATTVAKEIFCIEQRFPNLAPRDFAQGAARVVAFVMGLCAVGVWYRVCSVS